MKILAFEVREDEKKGLQDSAVRSWRMIRIRRRI